VLNEEGKMGKGKTAGELVRMLRDCVGYGLYKERAGSEGEDVGRVLAAIKQLVLAGDQDVQVQLAQEIHQSGIFLLLLKNFSKIDFESQKVFRQIFLFFLHRKGTQGPQSTIEHLVSMPDILFLLLEHHGEEELALHSGPILRECIQNQRMARIVLFSEKFFSLFAYVDSPRFDLASEAFATFRELLLRHKVLSNEFLLKNFDNFFYMFNKKLVSENFVTKKQFLILLNEMLHDRFSVFSVMLRYKTDPKSLKIQMNLLKDKSRQIQFCAFQVFYILVSNPDKSSGMTEILVRNRSSLVELLSSFLPEREAEGHFLEERQYIVNYIKQL